MRVLVIRSGHLYSTADVCDGLIAGLEMNGVQVVQYEFEKALMTTHLMAQGILKNETVPPEQKANAEAWATWLASADAVTMALEADVDAVIGVYGMLFATRRVLALRKLGIPVACVGTEAPYIKEELQFASVYTHWFTNERLSVAHFRQHGVNAYYLPHAYNPRTHQPGPADPDKRADVCFVGGFYDERKALFNGVDWQGISFAQVGTLRESTDPFVGAVSNEVTRAYYRSADIVLNHHRTTGNHWVGEQIDTTQAESLGPRAYEIAALGRFQLCDDARPELYDVFGDTAATYRATDSADLERQIRYWQAHPDARERRAADQYAAVQPHHWGARAAAILNVLTS